MDGKYGRTPRGKYSRTPLESEILAAQSISRSAKEAATKLGVSYNTYKKWARRYGIHETFKNEPGKKIPKVHRDPNKGAYPLNDILAGKHPNYPTYRLKDKLFKSGYKEEKCENCGWTEKRVTDEKGPFLIDFVDDDPRNKSLENIRILCLNCTHNIRGYINRGKKNFKHELNLDKMQREKSRLKIETVEVPLHPSEPTDDISLDDLSEEEIRQLLGDTE